MDKNANTLLTKRIIDVEILDLSEPGYGPMGNMKRKDWRDKCTAMLDKDEYEFKKWIESIENLQDHEYAFFNYKVIYDDKTFFIQEAECKRCSLDLIKNEFHGKNHSHVNFNIYKYPFPVLLSHAIFHDDVSFDSAVFADDLWVDNVVFHRKAIFNRVKIGGDAWFNNTEFLMDAQFVKTEFSNISVFKNIKVNDIASFENAIFHNVGHFEGAKFKTRVPNFLGVSIGTTHLEFSNETFFPEQDVTEQSIKYLERLKRLSDEHGQIDHALMFNAFELNAKRVRSMDEVNNLKWWQKLFNDHAWLAWTTYAYDKLSNYGRSFTRPLLAYLALMLVTWVLALGHGLWASIDACPREGWNVYEQLNRDQVSCPVVATVGEQKIPLTVLRAAFEYNAYRASGVLDFVDTDKQTIAVANRLFNQPIEPWCMRIWGAFKAIASIALLFLAALGLRNKYRIK